MQSDIFIYTSSSIIDYFIAVANFIEVAMSVIMKILILVQLTPNSICI